jgi:hypothetical protein
MDEVIAIHATKVKGFALLDPDGFAFARAAA